MIFIYNYTIPLLGRSALLVGKGLGDDFEAEGFDVRCIGTMRPAECDAALTASKARHPAKWVAGVCFGEERALLKARDSGRTHQG
jgi:hypothetical protein